MFARMDYVVLDYSELYWVEAALEAIPCAGFFLGILAMIIVLIGLQRGWWVSTRAEEDKPWEDRP